MSRGELFAGRLFAALVLIGTLGCYGTARRGSSDASGVGGVRDNAGSGGTSGSAGRGGGSAAGDIGTGGVGGAAGSVGGAAGTNVTVGGAGTSSQDASIEAVFDGGTDSAAKALGQVCSGNGECASGHCTGDVCCDQACVGACEQCSASGHCQMPADDPACGTIACPADSQCRDYATSISTNRCRALGQCKAVVDCSYVVAPAKMVCGYRQGLSQFPVFCDGAGNCVGPTVKCGGDGECPLYDKLCCGSEGNGYACKAVADCPGEPLKGGPYYCDERADCSGGDVCCAFQTPVGSGSGCLSASACESNPIAAYIQICNPTAIPSECATGVCQADTDGFVPYGWYSCK